MKNYKLQILSAIPVILIALILFGLKKADANPSQFMEKKTATATTTLTFMSAGAATSTLTFDTQEDGSYPVDSAILLVGFAGSSTASNLVIDTEYSQDGVAWYRNNLLDGGLASSTPFGQLSVKTPTSISWVFASSTVGGGILTTSSGATSTKAFTIATPTRYVRAVFSLAPVANGNGAFWAEFVGKKQR